MKKTIHNVILSLERLQIEPDSEEAIMNNISAKNKLNEQDLIFYIKVQFRCNSSMQGTVQWIDGKKTSKFRSVLELANLINDARQKASGGNKKDYSADKWEDKEIVS